MYEVQDVSAYAMRRGKPLDSYRVSSFLENDGYSYSPARMLEDWQLLYSCSSLKAFHVTSRALGGEPFYGILGETSGVFGMCLFESLSV